MRGVLAPGAYRDAMRRAHTVEQVRAAEEALMAQLPEGALMQRAAAGLAARGAGPARRPAATRCLRPPGAAAGRRGRQRRRRAVGRRPARAARVRGGGRAAGRPYRRGRPGRAAPRRRAHRRGRVLASPRRPGRRDRGHRRPVRACARARSRRWRCTRASPSSRSTSPRGSTSTPARLDGPHVRADLTVTFGTHKACHLLDPAAQACGAVHLVDLGLDLPEPAVESLQPARRRRAAAPPGRAGAQVHPRGRRRPGRLGDLPRRRAAQRGRRGDRPGRHGALRR